MEYLLSAGNFVCFPVSGQVGYNINKFVLSIIAFVNIVVRGIISGHLGNKDNTFWIFWIEDGFKKLKVFLDVL